MEDDRPDPPAGIETTPIGAPESSEYAPYYGRYISLVTDDDVLNALDAQIADTRELLSTLHGDHRYAPGKWSVNEVVGHLIDAERIFAYRALRIARNDATPLPGFEQDDYVRAANFDNCQLHDLAEEFSTVRRANLLMFGQLSPEAWLRRGTASENVVSVRAIAYIIAGHELHHRRILAEKYARA